MITHFPTASTALIQLRDGDYNLSQLISKVDGAVRDQGSIDGSTEEQVVRKSGEGFQEEERVASIESQASPTVQHENAPAAVTCTPSPNHIHVHSHTLEIALTPPKPTQRRPNAEGRQHDVPNPDRERFDHLLDDARQSFPPSTPFAILPYNDQALAVPVDSRGNVNTRAHGFQVLLPSKLKRQNITPFLKHVIYPYDQASKEWFSASAAWDTRNWIHAAIALDGNQIQTRSSKYRPEKQKVYMKSKLDACWVLDDAHDEQAEIHLILTIDLFLDGATLFDSAPDVGQDLLGLILHSVIPSPTSQPVMSDSERRASSLRHFFASVKPAPPIPNSRSFQPNKMVSKLLPFQNRTVALLIQRERAAPDRAKSNPQGFWTTFQLGSLGRVAYSRVTSELVRLPATSRNVASRKGKEVEVATEDGLSEEDAGTLPTLLDLSGVRGTMLCEEMGLGKTVEAIALQLLNRHPLSTDRRVVKPEVSPADTTRDNTLDGRGERPVNRNNTTIPTIDLMKSLDVHDDANLLAWWEQERIAFRDAVKRDEVAQIDVSQVAATLIVTPPSLLKQWVAEMAIHAPSLRVCVYTGWKDLLDSVGRRTTMDTRDRKARVTAKRKRDNDRRRARTIQKYQRGKVGTAVKVEHIGPSEGEDESGSEVESDVQSESLQQRTQRLFVDFVRAHDVVITTYQELSQDLAVAFHAPPRSRRANVDYRTGDRPRSPLVMVEWWRVIMDEVQLCGDSTAAANMVSLIPRQNSLAVSGTPAKTDIKDLMGSLRFLRVPVLPHDSRFWHRLQQPSMRPAFDGVFQTIAVRTTKKEVSGEFDLPHQSRFVIPIELSEIEMHYYNDTLERQRLVLGLPADLNAPRPDDWYLDTALFRSCLQNLRQICTHIQVGQMAGGGRDRSRLRLGRELMTLSEALARISEDHEAERLLTSRAQLRAMIRKAQLMVLRDRTADDVARTDIAILTLYERVREKATADIGPIRQHLDELLEQRESSVDEEDDGENHKNLSQQEREQLRELQHTRQSIRELLLILHQSWFFEGDFRHVQKETGAEINCYTQADMVRKEILARPLMIANASVEKVKAKLSETSAALQLRDLQTKETKRRPGILSDEPINQSNDLLKIMNENALLIYNWRNKIVELLTTPIDLGGDSLDITEETDVVDPEKEQYAEALKAQGEVEAYLMAYASAIADRREMLLEERSVLATHDARVKKTRTTKAAFQALVDSEIPPDVPDDVAKLAAELMAERQAVRDAREVQDCQKPLKALLMTLNRVVHGGGRVEEVAIASAAADWIRDYIDAQTEQLERLNKDLDLFRKTFNSRVISFAALQEISDSVTAPEVRDMESAIQEASGDITRYEGILARADRRGRYLKYLANRDETEDMRDDCLICMGSSDDTYGIFLECGHFFCDSCFREFRRSATGNKCPQCRTQIEPKLATKFKIGMPAAEVAAKAAEAAVHTVTDSVGDDEHASASQDEVTAVIPDLTPAQIEQQQRQLDLDRLNTMPIATRRAIASMDMMGDYGSKINFLVKHLLWYQTQNGSTRHVVFSNWSDSLRIVIQALMQNGIKFVSFDRGGRQGGDIVEEFKGDESIKVFLLHAERESAGLTLTSCSVVHLLEPVLKHSFELQAIGRVDRLGQKQETTVHCYATQDTVESRILSQGVRNGTSIYLREEEQGEQVIEDLDNVVSAAHKGGDIGLSGNEEEMLQLIML